MTKKIESGFVNEKTIRINLANSNENSKSGVQYCLNWGFSPEGVLRDPSRTGNETYIQLPKEVYESDFFPVESKFSIVDDEGKDFTFSRAQPKVSGGKPQALETTESNRIFGLYLRHRLGLKSGAFITYQDLTNYGRYDFTISKNNDDSYRLDFSSVKKTKSDITKKITELKLSTTAKECARQIFDKLYEYDKFEKILPLFKINTNIKIDCSEVCADNVLYNVFYTSISTQYTDSLRTFTDRNYSIKIDNTDYVCRLTTQWCGFGSPDGDNAGSRNWLWALRDIVNLHYTGIFKIENDGANANLLFYEQNKQNETIVVSADIFNKSILEQFGNNPTTLRYIRALLSKPFAILTGNSGTGKTRIALRLAKYLEKLSSDGKGKNSLLIPVGADWTDNTKLLGFYNPITHKYQSTKTLDFILNAKNNPDIPFFLILDEMNLSHVERYFSDFLSAMESGEEIPLYKKENESSSDIPESIVLPQNLFVTGTVNIDETTYMFSPKVLDRANVIEFKPEMDDVLSLLSADSTDDDIKIAESGVAEAFLLLAKKMCKANPADYSAVSLESAKTVLHSLYEKLSQSGFEFAFRTVKEIRRYIIASYELADDKKNFNLESALDEQIVQKILPKIHGNRKQIGKLLEDLKTCCNAEKYPISNAKIAQMQDKLEKYQYASFI